MPSVSLNTPITFQAKWNPQNEHLADSICDKVTRVFFYGINFMVTRMILPSTLNTREEIACINDKFEEKWTHPSNCTEKLLANYFTRSPLEITTPDGVKLEGTHFQSRGAAKNAPTVIFFQPNAMISKQGNFDWILQNAALQEIPYNFVYFDYRGTIGDETPKNSKDLFLDGDSIYQCVKDKLQVPENDIHFYGWSLGGGISSNVKKILPGCLGRYVNERSFSSIQDVISNSVPYLVAMIAGSILSLLHWNIESTSAIESFKSKTLIVHHPQDEIMQTEANLANKIFSLGTNSPISFLDLSQSPEIVNFYHGAPLTFFNDEDFRPDEQICQFLFDTRQSFNQRMIQIFQHASPQFQTIVYNNIAQCREHVQRSLTEREFVESIVHAKMILQ